MAQTILFGCTIKIQSISIYLIEKFDEGPER